MFKTWREWHKFMKRAGATCTIENRNFLLDGGCPRCGCKSWQITSDGWAYCNSCHYGQSQLFHVSERVDVYEICPEHPYGCPDDRCRKKEIEKMKQNKVKEVQDYLKEKGIHVSEVAIIDASITIARRLGAGDYTFALEFEEKKK